MNNFFEFLKINHFSNYKLPHDIVELIFEKYILLNYHNNNKISYDINPYITKILCKNNYICSLQSLKYYFINKNYNILNWLYYNHHIINYNYLFYFIDNYDNAIWLFNKYNHHIINNDIILKQLLINNAIENNDFKLLHLLNKLQF